MARRSWPGSLWIAGGDDVHGRLAAVRRVHWSHDVPARVRIRAAPGRVAGMRSALTITRATTEARAPAHAHQPGTPIASLSGLVVPPPPSSVAVTSSRYSCAASGRWWSRCPDPRGADSSWRRTVPDPQRVTQQLTTDGAGARYRECLPRRRRRTGPGGRGPGRGRTAPVLRRPRRTRGAHTPADRARVQE